MESAMPINTTLLNVGETAMKNAATHATINTTYPDATGATADTTRVVLNWAGVTSFTGGTGSGPAVGVGLWNADGTTYYGDLPLAGDLTFNAAGEYNLNSADLTGSAS